MPSERAIVETLNRKELTQLVGHFDLDVADRRVREHMVHALATAPQVTLASLLEQLPLATLKTLCVKQGLDAKGRGKAVFVERLAAAAKPKASAAKSRIKAVKSAKAAKPAKVATPATKKPAPKAAASKKAIGKKAPGKAAPKAAQAKPAPKATRKASKKIAAKALKSPRTKKPKAAAAAAPEAVGAPATNVIALPYANTPAAVAAAQGHLNHFMPTDAALWAPSTRTETCHACSTKLELRKCTAQKCQNMLIASPTRKICAECMFERNTLSMDEFNQRMDEEATCPHCGKAWQNLS